MELKDIKSIGNFLSSYHSDLVYIYNFQKYKHGEISAESFIKKEAGSFYKFLIDFRVVRNFPKGQTNLILKETTNWIRGENADDIDGFAHLLKKRNLTHDNIPISLASKILFLNNPWSIYPFDTQAKNAISFKDKTYSSYLISLLNFKKNNTAFIRENLKEIERYLIYIESDFKKSIADIKTIRQNRFLDKILWTTGK